MLISLATMDFRLCHILRERLNKGGFSVEHISPGDQPSEGSIVVVTTEREETINPTNYPRKVVLTRSEVGNVNLAISKITLGLEGKHIWESVVVGVDPGLTIGVAVITDGCLRATLETRVIKEAVNYVITSLKNTPAKMAIIRLGSTGGYRRVLLMNELLQAKPNDVDLEIVDELETTPINSEDAKEALKNGTRGDIEIEGGKDATAAMEIAFRLGESVKCPEKWVVSEGELKEIQVLSRQFSKGDITITKELARKVACGVISIEEAILLQKKTINF
ncbi:MAG: hypothetical protein ACTSPM_08885 [Candidatus Heimdallarchaeota archaeon]